MERKEREIEIRKRSGAQTEKCGDVRFESSSSEALVQTPILRANSKTLQGESW